MPYVCTTCGKIHETGVLCTSPLPLSPKEVSYQLARCKVALWKIAVDYHEDNPARHLNPVAAWEVADKALKEIGAIPDGHE